MIGFSKGILIRKLKAKQWYSIDDYCSITDRHYGRYRKGTNRKDQITCFRVRFWAWLLPDFVSAVEHAVRMREFAWKSCSNGHVYIVVFGERLDNLIWWIIYYIISWSSECLRVPICHLLCTLFDLFGARNLRQTWTHISDITWEDCLFVCLHALTRIVMQSSVG